MHVARTAAAVLCRTSWDRGAERQSGLEHWARWKISFLLPEAAAFTSFLPAFSQAAGCGPGAVAPLSPTPPCLSQTPHNASSHSSSSACDRPGAAERALSVRERGFPGVGEGVLLCSLLMSSRGSSEFSWSWCQATPHTPVQQTLWPMLLLELGARGR